MNGKQFRNALLAIILTVDGTPSMPKGLPKLPPLTELQAKNYKPALDALWDSYASKQVKAVVRQPIKNVFKGGFKKTSLPRLGLFNVDNIGFWFFDIVQIMDIASAINDEIFGDYAGFIDDEPFEVHWAHHAPATHHAAEMFRQGETTQDAMDRTIQEAKQCCKAVAQASSITLKNLNTVLQEFTYKSADVVPRATVKKRTRL